MLLAASKVVVVVAAAAAAVKIGVVAVATMSVSDLV